MGTRVCYSCGATMEPLFVTISDVYGKEEQPEIILRNASRRGGQRMDVCPRCLHTALTSRYGDQLLSEPHDKEQVPGTPTWQQFLEALRYILSPKVADSISLDLGEKPPGANP